MTIRSCRKGYVTPNELLSDLTPLETMRTARTVSFWVGCTFILLSRCPSYKAKLLAATSCFRRSCKLAFSRDRFYQKRSEMLKALPFPY